MGSRNNKPGRIVKGTALQPTLKSASGVWSLDEAMQAHRANAWPQPNLFQPVANSLRVKQQGGSTSAGVLSKSIVREGDRRRFTMSMWVKLGTLTAPGGSIRTLWEGFTGTDNSYYLIYISSGNQLYVGRDDNGNPSGTTATWAGVLRDPTAWYHIVISTDTLQSTAANRVKVWINGVQQTLGGDFPTQGYAVAMGRDRNNNSITNGFGPGIRIGSRWNTTFDQNFDGLYGEVNFVDGYQLDPSLFGKFDTNNTWVPVPYTGAYGTNGFYLPFTNAATSQTLGYDASLTGTATYDVDQDPYRGSVALHLTGNGPAGGNNNVFADSGPNNYAVTRNGIVTQGSFSPFPFNTNTPYNPAQHGASMYQAEVINDFPSFPTGSQGSNFTFAGDFTIEGWVYYTSASSGDTSFYVSTQDGSSYFALNISMSAGNYNIYLNSGATAIAHGITANAWTHVAMVRSGSTVTLYTNGVSKGTLTNSSTLGYSTLTMNRCGGGVGGVTRYMSSFRIVKAAIYTAAFTPTMRPFGTLTTNLLTFSEDFNNAYWTQGSITVTPNAAVAPDGNPSATKLTASSTGSIAPQIYKYPNPNLSNSTTYTLSVYAKAAEYNYIVLNNNDGLASYRTWFNLTTGTVGTNASGNTASMVSVGNGWYRCIVYRTMAASSAANSLQGIQISNADAADTFSATAGSGIYIWGAQIEQGTSATNYTPTPANFSTAPALLLNFANAAVTDTAGGDNILTGSSATITSASKYGSGAMTFNGTSDFVAARSTTSYTFGTANFTIEYWVYFNSVAATQCVAAAYDSNGADATSPAAWTIRSNGVLGWEGYFGSTSYVGTGLTPTATVTANTWYHVATVRNNGEIIAFLNGRVVGRVSVGTAAVAAPGGGVHIGRAGLYNGQFFNGSVDDFRVTKGVARYQSDFTPPARALPEVGGKSFVTSNINAGVVQRFTTTGTTSWTAPTDVTSVEVLVVAGGGGAGSSGGGGGAGGLIYNNSYPVTPGQTYTVTIGAGGNGGAQNAMAGTASNGSNSIFGNLVATGGGGGGNWGTNGAIGGSGGGAGRDGGSGAAGIAGQGFTGGNTGSGNEPSGGGGGGGAGAVGSAGVTNGTGNGGVGLQFGISGSPTYYAGGGGGAGYNAGTNGAGGSGIGGTGGTNASRTPTTPTANTGSGAGGGGGGGGGANAGGTGATGIVVVRYTTTAVGNTSDATTDNLVDSPTLYGHDTGAGGEVVGNYATFNPIYAQSATITLSNGNLTASNPSTWVRAMGTIAVNTGKWYFESTPSAGNWHMTGVEQPIYSTTHIGGSATKGIALVYDPSNTRGDISYNGGNSVYTGGSVTFNAGDVIGVALDLDNNNVKLYKNNVLQYNLSNLLQAGAYYTFGVSLYSGGTISGNFGQRAWAYAPPAGYNALTTKNLPRLTNAAAIAPNQYFDTVLYTGTGAAQTITLPGAFQPDLVWMKARSSADNHVLMDVVRGTSAALFSDLTNAEVTNATRITSFNSNGFTLGSSASVNTSSATYVAWCWRAGGAAVSNTAGAITSQVSANTASGFSVVTYTGSGTQASVGHGLSAAPELIITKARNQTGGWYTYTTVIDGSMDYFLLNTNAAKGDSGLAVPTSTVFYNDGWSASYNMLAYCFHSVPGYSKIGTYVGNGSADGVFLYLGFKPKFVLIKRTNVTEDWVMVDASRNPNNVTNLYLLASSAGAEGTVTLYDFVSNGIKFRSNSQNELGSTYIYMAFADKSFGNVNGVAR